MISTEPADSVMSRWVQRASEFRWTTDTVMVLLLLNVAVYYDVTGANVFVIPGELFAAVSYVGVGAGIVVVAITYLRDSGRLDWETHG